MKRVDVSPTVKVIGFPDLFDLDEIDRVLKGRRLVSLDAPFGMVEHPPTPDAEICGTVTLSGWALDSVALVGVTIEREPLPGEPNKRINERGLVPIADARLGIERQDVASVYPDFRQSAEAGWLAEFRPEHIFSEPADEIVLHVWAFSLDRPPTELGVRRIRFGIAPAMEETAE
jgi:hypothetical protein